MKKIYPDKKSLLVLRIAAAAAATLLITAVVMLFPAGIITFTVSAVLTAVAAVIIFIYLPLYYKYTCYYVYANEIRKTSGVFFRTSRSIKYSSIQYSTHGKTLLSAFSGMNFIILYVYGGKMLLLFLSDSDAETILKMAAADCRGEKNVS